jgi:methanogenic corrinoid protein MtbC1
MNDDAFGFVAEAWPVDTGVGSASPVRGENGGSIEPGPIAGLARLIERHVLPRVALAQTARRAARPSRPSRTLPDPGVEFAEGADVASFARLVLTYDASAARAFVESRRRAGAGLEDLYLELLAPVARYLGELWEADAADFTEVTLALGCLHQVLRELSPEFQRGAIDTCALRRILLVPAPGDQHTFGLSMVAEFFRRDGWDVSGGPACSEALARSVQESSFDVVGFSLSVERWVDPLTRCISAIRRQSRNRLIGVIVGGPLIVSRPDLVTRLGADVAAGGRDAPGAAFALVSRLRRD